MLGRMKRNGSITYTGVRLADLNQRLTTDTVIRTSKAFANAVTYLKGDCDGRSFRPSPSLSPSPKAEPTLLELNELLKDSAMIPVRRKWYSLKTGVRFGPTKEPMYTLSEARVEIEECGPFFGGASL